MGYFVRITDQNFMLKKEHLDAAYAALCALNDRDDLKSGGSYGGGQLSARDERPAGMDHHPAKWFSWMPADYPSKYKTMQEILENLGFTLSADADGNIYNLEYDSKIGNEDHFFEVLAEFIEPGSYICWMGEDGTEWRWFFENKTMKMQGLQDKVWG